MPESIPQLNLPVPPGATIGILGGGQLGRMLAVSAAQLGYEVHIFAPEANSPAAKVAAHFTCADWDDRLALRQFARQCDIITLEFENIPIAALQLVQAEQALFPRPRALVIAQSRIEEKDFVAQLGGRTAPYAFVERRDQLAKALAHTGAPAILKSNRFGYDGKGQARIGSREQNLDLAWQEAGGGPAILEGFVKFDAEFSVILLRGHDGGICFWDVPENTHCDGILVRSALPASAAVQDHLLPARALSRRIAEKLDYIGVLTVEFFACHEGPIFNELAPRVHNSGHWTIEGAKTSQFENHIRGICGLPIGDCSLNGQSVVMDNLIGTQASDWRDILNEQDAHLHLYGKREMRAGRKMGHVTRVVG